MRSWAGSPTACCKSGITSASDCSQMPVRRYAARKSGRVPCRSGTKWSHLSSHMIPLLRRRSEASAMLDRGEASDDGTAKLQRGVAHGVVAALCWGSWADTFRSVKKFRRELFCWDCAIGTFLAPLDYAYTMGSGGQDHPGFLVQVRTADAIEYRLGDPGWRDL